MAVAGAWPYSSLLRAAHVPLIVGVRPGPLSFSLPPWVCLLTVAPVATELPWAAQAPVPDLRPKARGLSLHLYLTFVRCLAIARGSSSPRHEPYAAWNATLRVHARRTPYTQSKPWRTIRLNRIRRSRC